jgi:hypothetical protein
MPLCDTSHQFGARLVAILQHGRNTHRLEYISDNIDIGRIHGITVTTARRHTLWFGGPCTVRRASAFQELDFSNKPSPAHVGSFGELTTWLRPGDWPVPLRTPHFTPYHLSQRSRWAAVVGPRSDAIRLPPSVSCSVCLMVRVAPSRGSSSLTGWPATRRPFDGGCRKASIGATRG